MKSLSILAFILLAGGTSVSAPPPSEIEAGSLFFTGIIDEVTDRLDILAEGTAADVGAGDFTIELWLKPTASNTEGSVSQGSSYLFPNTNIFMDRDNLSTTRDFGAGLAAGRVVFSVENGNGAYTVVGTSDIRDSQCHHVAMQRSASNGLISLYVDGDREATATGPTGTIALPGGISGAERYLVFGTEKHGFDVAGYYGHISAIHIFDSLRYTGTTYAVPTAPIEGALARYLMDEGTGTTVADSAGSNDGFIAAGGVPAWSTDNCF